MGQSFTVVSGVNPTTINQRLSANFTSSVITAGNTNLAFPTGANETWCVEIRLSAQCSGSGGSKFAISAPTGAAIEGWLDSSTLALTTKLYQRLTAPNAPTAVPVHAVAALPAPDVLTFTVTNGPTPGMVILQAASVTAGQITTIFAGSSLVATKAVNV